MKKKVNWPVTILMMIGALCILFPLLLTVMIALKSPQEMMDVLAWPKELRWQNFSEAIEMTHFFRALKNSSLITVGAVALVVLTNSLVGYAVARNLEHRVFKAAYYYFISAMFIPFSVIMLPLVKQVSGWHMDNRGGLVVLYMIYGLSFNIFLYVGYIKSIPLSVDEAAIIDGASYWQVFIHIIFPLLKPINATVLILSFLSTWNDFMLPLITLNDSKDYTLPLVQYVFQSQFSTNYNLAFASYILALLPVLVVYLFAQNQIISGVTNGAVK